MALIALQLHEDCFSHPSINNHVPSKHYIESQIWRDFLTHLDIKHEFTSYNGHYFFEVFKSF